MDRLHRRDFLVATGAAAATAATAAAASEGVKDHAAPALASGPREVHLAMPWADTIAGFGDSASRLARRIETASGGRFRIVPVPASAAAGDADLTHGFESARVDRHSAFAYFGGLPGFTALNALDLDAWLAVGGGQDLWDDLAAEYGVKPLLAGHTGRWPGLWSAVEVRGLADLAGRGILALGLARDVAAGLGAKPLDIAAEAWGPSLASGAAIAAEWGGPQANMALGLAASTNYVFARGIAPSGSVVSLGVRRRFWESLSTGDQALFSACASEEFRLTLAEARAHELALRRALTEAHGIRFLPLPEDVLAALSGVADAVVAHAASADGSAARINASYMAFRHAVTGFEAPGTDAAVS